MAVTVVLPTIEYNRFYEPNTELFVCLFCGAAVRDTETHTKWHDRTYEIMGEMIVAARL